MSTRRGRDPTVVGTGSSKRPKTETSRRKITDTEASNTTLQPAAARGKKSRSPSLGRSRPDPFIAPTHPPKRKKSSMHLTAGEAAAHGEDPPDRGHKMRSTSTTPLHSSTPKHRPKKENTHTLSKDKDADMQTSVYSSSLAMAESERQKTRLRLEVDELKKELHKSKKVMKKQEKVRYSSLSS